MSTRTLQWHCIAADLQEISFAANGIAVVEVKGKKICLAQHLGQLYAFAYKCPHASGLMSEGWIDPSGQVVCPTHRYKFNITNGRNTTGEGYHLKHWPVEQRPEGIFVGMESFGLFS
jgi:nitrite reductase/ring-hydroxylating ferredoxin subunit